MSPKSEPSRTHDVRKATEVKASSLKSQAETEHNMLEAKPAAMVRRAGEPPQLLSRGDVVHLQRVLGNRAVGQLLTRSQPATTARIQAKMLPASQLIQRKPPDIDNTSTLNYDTTGALTNVGAPRATLKRATIINAQLRDGWVTPKEELIGGHLFKREFGGLDDETNVVPWKQEREDAFTLFEDDYKAAADKDAEQAAKSTLPFTATVHTKAQFVDRPDLEVTDLELDTVGWGPLDPEREKRKKQYADVADKFSGIPTAVAVEVHGVTGGAKRFTAAHADIAPAYSRNDEAIKPAYVVPTRFMRNAKEPRNFTKVTNWSKQKEQAKLKHVASRHPTHFGLTDKVNKTDLQRLETTLQELVNTGEQIVGLYRKEEVLHYVDASHLWLCTKPAGELVAAFKLSDDQYLELTTKGLVR